VYTYRVKSVNRIVDGSMGKYGRVLGWLFVGEDDVSLNEQMINEGFAWKYDGGTKKKDLQSLIDIRKSQGTY
jgi:micrococcal nuclease